MTTGYPDFVRLQTFGGYELLTKTGSVASGTTIFAGYVGSWPYLNIFTGTVTQTDYYQIKLTYYTDSTYSTMAATQSVTRFNLMSTITQRTVLGPWVKAVLTTASGNAITTTGITIYGSYGNAAGVQLHTGSEAIWQLDDTIGAGLTETYNLTTVSPGPASFALYAPKPVWGAFILYYSWAQSALAQTHQFDQTIGLHGGVWTVPMVDAPYQIQIFNGSTSAQEIVASLISTAY